MQENYHEYKELIDSFDNYYSSLSKIKKIINQKNFNVHFNSIAIDELLENTKIKNKEIKLKSSNYLLIKISKS